MTPADEPILDLRKLSKTFGEVQALDGVDLTVQPGEFHATLFQGGPAQQHSKAHGVTVGQGQLNREAAVAQLQVSSNDIALLAMPA